MELWGIIVRAVKERRSGVRAPLGAVWQRVLGLWPAWLIVGGFLVVVGFDLWAAFVQPSWLLDTSGLKGADLAKTRSDFRGMMLTALAGLAVLTGAVVGALNLGETQRQNRALLELQRRGQVTERFTRAIDQLGRPGPENLDVRIGAVYALEQIAWESDDLHWPIMQVLTAYLRGHVHILKAEKARPDVLGSRTEGDIQAIAFVLGRRRTSHDRPNWALDLRDLDLRNVVWFKAQLAEAFLNGTWMNGVDLSGANLCQAHLIGADLTNADLKGADLTNADLKGADLREARGLTLEQLRLAANVDQAQLPTALAFRLGQAARPSSDLS